MKLSIDELLTNVDASDVKIVERSPLSLDRIIQTTISNCNDHSSSPTRFAKRLHLFFVAATLIGLLASTALAETIVVYLESVDIEFQVSEDGKILPTEIPNFGITFSVSNVTPRGMLVTYFVERGKFTGTVSTGSGYYLEIKTDNGWTVVPKHYEPHWFWDNIELDEGQYCWNIDWTDIYGELQSGNYRIRISVSVTTADGEVKLYFPYEEFLIP